MDLHGTRRRMATACGVPPEDFWDLKPEPATPPERHCSCPGRPPVKLVGGAGASPLRCMNCNREVEHRPLGLRRDLILEIERWRDIAGGIYNLLWGSTEYEAWAGDQLAAPDSPVNRLGRSLQEELDRVFRCFYDFYFEDDILVDLDDPGDCPICTSRLRVYDGGESLPQATCDPCGIVITWLAPDDP